MKRHLRSAALLLLLAGLAACTRTTIVYAPRGIEGATPEGPASCAVDWERYSNSGATVGELRAYLRGRSPRCDQLRLLTHRAGAPINWRSDDRSIGNGERIRQVLVETDRDDPLRPLLVHAVVGQIATSGLPPVTTLIEGPPGQDGQNGQNGTTITERAVPGAQGERGPPGEQGPVGEPGPPGAPGLIEQTTSTTDNEESDRGSGGGGRGNGTDPETKEAGASSVQSPVPLIASGTAGAALGYALAMRSFPPARPLPVPGEGPAPRPNAARPKDPEAEGDDGGPEGPAEPNAAEPVLADSRLRVASAQFRSA